MDEFRKITAIEKLPPIEHHNFYRLLEDQPAENKFLRIRKEPFEFIEDEDKAETKMRLIKKNQLVGNLVENNYQKIENSFSQRDHVIRDTAEEYIELSKNNTQENHHKKYKFYHGGSSPPPKIAAKSLGETAYRVIAMNENNASQANQNVDKHILIGEKFNFHEINHKRD